MRNLKTYEEFLFESELINEIGETSEIYDYEEERNPFGKGTDFYFTTKAKKEYRVSLNYEGSSVLVIEFGIMNDKYDSDFYTVSDDKDFKVFSTIIHIIKEKVNSDENIEWLKYSPARNFKKDRRREKIYSYYLEKHLPIGKFKELGDWRMVPIIR